MAFPRKLKDLCTPAMIYFVISMIGIFLAILQNIGNENMYQFGEFTCRVPNTMMVMIVKIVYVLFWTWILNLICKDGYVGISWFLVLMPWIFLFVMMVLIMMNQ